MSDHRPSLSERLQRIDPEQARLQSAMIGAFNRRRIGGLETHARLAPERDRHAAAGWLRFRTRTGHVSIAPLLVNGVLAHVTAGPGAPDAIAAAALLAPIEPLVAAIETALGDALHPDGLDETVAGEPVMIRLDAGRPGGGVDTRLLVALATDAAAAPFVPPPIVHGALDRVRLTGRAILPGPAVPAGRLAALAAGDLLVLGIAPLRARLSFFERGGAFGVGVDMKQGALIVQDHAGESVDGAPAPTADLAAVRVPTSIELAGISLPAGEVATLAPGSVVPLPQNGGTLAVRLRAGGELVADGELVAVGDGFGVLVTRRHDMAAD